MRNPFITMTALGFSLGAGCAPGVQGEISFSEVVPTVGSVSWSAAVNEADAAWLSYGLKSLDEHTAALSLDGSPARVLGFKAGHRYQAKVVIEQDGAQTESEVFEFDIEAAPADFPGTSVQFYDKPNAHDKFLLTTLFASPAVPVILDADGDYVWWYIPENADEVNYSRAALSSDHETLYAWTLNIQTLGAGDGPGGGGGDVTDMNDETFIGADHAFVSMSWDGTDVTVEKIDDGHHDMVTLPDGGIAYLERDFLELDLIELEGDRIIERSPDGTTQEVWSIWDDFSRDGSDQGGTAGTGWSHANALDYDAEQDAYYLSSLGLGMIVKIDRPTGTLEWVLGGEESDFVDESGTTDLFTHQHQFDREGNRIIVFDNGDAARAANRILEFELNEQAGTATQVWSYQPEVDIYSFSLGDVARLENGNTIITYSNQGQINEVDAAGELVWQLNFDLGGAVGYLTLLDGLP